MALLMSGALLRLPTPAVGQADTPGALPPFTVLLIDEFQPSRPLWQEFVNALTGSLTSVSGRRVVFFEENLDERHLSNVSILQESAGWYLQKYRERPIDLIIV